MLYPWVAMKNLFRLSFIFLITLISLTSSSFVFAAKPRPRPAGGSVVSTGSSFISVRLRSDRLALFVNFLNLSQYNSISYILTYNTDGVDQGVQGSVPPAGQGSTSRELLFGTCSKNVCRYHQNIKNMHFVITAQTLSGKTLVKKFLIRP